ncbi:MAG: hypothetical protein AVDCRST_MAG19-2976, partial [uncultured Thermomicrobiales bacterium]
AGHQGGGEQPPAVARAVPPDGRGVEGERAPRCPLRGGRCADRRDGAKPGRDV